MSRQSTYFNTCIGAQDQLSNVLTQNELLWSQFPIPHINLEKFQFTRNSLGQKNAPFPRNPINKYQQHILETKQKKHLWTVKICVFLKKTPANCMEKTHQISNETWTSTQQKPQEKKRPHGHPFFKRWELASRASMSMSGNPEIKSSSSLSWANNKNDVTTCHNITWQWRTPHNQHLPYIFYGCLNWKKTWNLDCCRPLCFSFKLKIGKLNFCLTNHLWEGFHLKVTTNITCLCRVL